MERIRRIFGREHESTPAEPIDIDELLASARRDPRERSTTLETLRAERKRLQHQRKVVDRRFKRLTSGRTKMIGYSSSGNPNIAANMLGDAMRAASDANHVQDNDELVALDQRLAAVDQAIAEVQRTAR